MFSFVRRFFSPLRHLLSQLLGHVLFHHAHNAHTNTHTRSPSISIGHRRSLSISSFTNFPIRKQSVRERTNERTNEQTDGHSIGWPSEEASGPNFVYAKISLVQLNTPPWLLGKSTFLSCGNGRSQRQAICRIMGKVW